MAFSLEDLFTEACSLGQRDWGEEYSLYNCPGRYTFKLLKLNAGSKGGLQYHQKKDEITYIVSGRLLVRFDLDNGDGLQERLLEPGEWIRFPKGMVHQEEAITDVVRIEASSPFLNDRVRVEESYGLPSDGGLPSTSLEQIIEI